MNVDLSQFHQVFFEETLEHLDTLERVLLATEPEHPAEGEIDALFRAAHSIKGSAGTFGFQDLAEIAHHLENSLDRVRRGKLSLSSTLVDAALRAVDLLRRHLAAHRGAGEADPAALASLPTLLRQAEQAPRPADAVSMPAKADTPAAAPAPLIISYAPDADATPEALDALLNALLDLGAMEILESGTSEGRWRFSLQCAHSPMEVAARLTRLVAPASLQVECAGQSGPSSRAPAYGFFPDAPGAPKIPAAANEAAEPAPAKVLPLEAPVQLLPEAAAAMELGSIRVSVPKVDLLVNLMSELVINQAMLAQAAAGLDTQLHPRLCLGIEQYERHTRALQEAVMSLRLMPIGFVFSRFPRLVRDLAQSLGKDVRLATLGEATELDRGLVEKIADPLTHLLRNSLDHGIEPAAARRAAGKDPVGTITLEAYHQGGSMVIEVSDDGAGLDRDRILAKAREKGLPVSEGMGDEEVWRLIFTPGFSTAREITAVSGRGVGMDVVQKNVHGLGGRIEINSRPGLGTTFRLRLPLTLAILDGMAVAVGEELYVLPLSLVLESLQPAARQLKRVAGREHLVQVREDYLPLLALHELLEVRPRHIDPAQGIVVVIECDGRRLALQVDDLVLQQQFVVKNLERNYRRVPGIAGATILGDGRVALILDPAGLARRHGERLARAA